MCFNVIAVLYVTVRTPKICEYENVELSKDGESKLARCHINGKKKINKEAKKCMTFNCAAVGVSCARKKFCQVIYFICSFLYANNQCELNRVALHALEILQVGLSFPGGISLLGVHNLRHIILICYEG